MTLRTWPWLPSALLGGVLLGYALFEAGTLYGDLLFSVLGFGMAYRQWSARSRSDRETAGIGRAGR